MIDVKPQPVHNGKRIWLAAAKGGDGGVFGVGVCIDASAPKEQAAEMLQDYFRTNPDIQPGAWPTKAGIDKKSHLTHDSARFGTNAP